MGGRRRRDRDGWKEGEGVNGEVNTLSLVKTRSQRGIALAYTSGTWLRNREMLLMYVSIVDSTSLAYTMIQNLQYH